MYLKNDISYLIRFSQFISFKSIVTAEQINNQLFEEYDYYLRLLKNERTRSRVSRPRNAPGRGLCAAKRTLVMLKESENYQEIVHSLMY